jgi:replicative DNA helicase
VDRGGATVTDLHARVRRLCAEGEVHLVIVDYLQLMSAGRKFENRNQEVTWISRGLKLLSHDIHAPLMVLSQLSRAPEARKGSNRPVLSDLRESGSLEQDADVVAFLYREEMYHRDREDLRGIAELILGKQRSGPTGTINLVYLHALTKFENRAEDTYSSSPAPLLEPARRLDRRDNDRYASN